MESGQLRWYIVPIHIVVYEEEMLFRVRPDFRISLLIDIYIYMFRRR